MTPYTTNEMIKPLYLCLMLVAHGPSEQSTTSGKSHAMLYSSLNFKFHLLGSRGGTVVECLLPRVQPEFDSQTWSHMRVVFVVCSCPCSKGFFPGSPSFLPSTKNQHSKFQIDMETLDKKNQLVECPLLNPIYFIYLPISPFQSFIMLKKLFLTFK